jgi:hypothetical protein
MLAIGAISNNLVCSGSRYPGASSPYAHPAARIAWRRGQRPGCDLQHRQGKGSRPLGMQRSLFGITGSTGSGGVVTDVLCRGLWWRLLAA